MPNTQDKEIKTAERVKRIIGILRLDGREIDIHLPHYIEVAKVVETSNDTFSVKLSNPLIRLRGDSNGFVSVHFIFSGTELFCKCKLIDQSYNKAILGYPEVLISRSKRRHPRVRLKNITPAELTYKQLPEKRMEKVSPENVSVKYSQLYWEAQRENPDIKKTLLLTGKEIKKISPYSHIVLYNEKNITTKDAHIMRKSGKVLYVDDCSKIPSYTRFISSEFITSYSYYLNEKKLAGTPQENLLSELREIVNEDRANRCTSKVVVPLSTQEGVIGHIKVVKKEKGKKITYEEITDLLSLSAILTLALENAQIIPDLGDSIQSNLIDISEGGLFLRIPDEEDELSFTEGSDIQVTFDINKKKMKLKGNILRKDDQVRGYAVQFKTLNNDEKKALQGFVKENIEKSKGKE